MFGLFPASPYHLLALIVPLVLWLVGRQLAKKHHVTIMHDASFAVSYWEEVLFRGIIWGIILGLTGNVWIALVGSSLLFGLFHLRNSWWATKKRLLNMCLYTGFVIGPLLGFVQILTGDIYIGIALHAVHNFINIYLGSSKLPTDDFLRLRKQKRNWFQRLFSSPGSLLD